jgi:hypothetical protein
MWLIDVYGFFTASNDRGSQCDLKMLLLNLWLKNLEVHKLHY